MTFKETLEKRGRNVVSLTGVDYFAFNENAYYIMGNKVVNLGTGKVKIIPETINGKIGLYNKLKKENDG